MKDVVSYARKKGFFSGKDAEFDFADAYCPADVGGVLWFGNDDAHMITYTPVYCSSLRSPACYNDPAASDVDFSWDSAFWVCNWVSNMTYQRYSKLFPDVRKVRGELQDRYVQAQNEVDRKALGMSDAAARAEVDGKFLTTEEGRGVAPLREGYPDSYRRVIAEMTGDRYLSPVK